MPTFFGLPTSIAELHATFDTLAELNAILTDATLIDTNDPRLSNALIVLSAPPADFDAPGEEGQIYYGKQSTVYYKGGEWRQFSVSSGTGAFPLPVD